LGRDQELLVDPQAVELRESIARLARISLVDHQDRRLAEAAEVGPNLLVGGDQALLAVHQEKQQVALLDRQENLLVESQGIITRYQAAGIDNLDRPVVR